MVSILFHKDRGFHRVGPEYSGSIGLQGGPGPAGRHGGDHFRGQAAGEPAGCDRAAEESTEDTTAEAARTMAVSSLVAPRCPVHGQRADDEIARTNVLFVPPLPGLWGDLLP